MKCGAFGRTAHIYVMSQGRIVEYGDRDALQVSKNRVVRQLLDRRGHR
jgi:hypothetical protein